MYLFTFFVCVCVPSFNVPDGDIIHIDDLLQSLIHVVPERKHLLDTTFILYYILFSYSQTPFKTPGYQEELEENEV